MVVDFAAWARVAVVENIWRLIICVWTGSEHVLFLRKYEVLGAAAFGVFAAEWIKHKISEMDISLTRIQQCVIGDAEYGQIGLVKQVEEHQA